jgi:hypothetical protein
MGGEDYRCIERESSASGPLQPGGSATITYFSKSPLVDSYTIDSIRVFSATFYPQGSFGVGYVEVSTQ